MVPIVPGGRADVGRQGEAPGALSAGRRGSECFLGPFQASAAPSVRWDLWPGRARPVGWADDSLNCSSL